MSLRLTGPLLASVVAIASVAPGASHAASSYDSCTNFIDSIPVVISTQGTWCLRKDLSTNLTSGSAILVAVNNVTVDCNGYKIGNLGAGLGTATWGIEAIDKLNLTIRDCMIRGFQHGALLAGDASAGHLIERNVFDSNRYSALLATGAGTIVRGNRFVDTGGSTVATGNAYALTLASGANALDNVISGVEGSIFEEASSATAITVNPNSTGTLVRGNAIRDVVSVGGGTSTGIHTVSTGTQMRENHIVGPLTVAMACANATSAAIGNFTTAVTLPIDICTAVDNVDTD